MPLDNFGVHTDRRWAEICATWISYISDDLSLEGATEIPSVVDHLEALQVEFPAEETAHYVGDVPAVRSIILMEAVHYTARAAAFICAAQRAWSQGQPSIANLLAYDASFFASRGSLSFLGISRFERSSRTFVVDIWPGLGARTSQGRVKPWTADILISNLGPRFLHEAHWSAVIYTFRKVKGAAFGVDLLSIYRRFKRSSDFSNRRNSFLYRGNWKLADLLSDEHIEGFGSIDDLDSLDDTALDLDLKIAQILCAVNLELFKGIASKSGKLKQLAAEFEDTFRHDRHPIMYDGILAGACNLARPL